VQPFCATVRQHTGTSFWVDAPWHAWYALQPLQQLPRGVMLWHDFLQQCGQPGIFTVADDNKLSSSSGSSTAVVMNAATTSFKKLQSLADVPLLVHNWDNDPEKELQFGFQVCHKRKDLKSGPLAPEPGVDYSLDRTYRY
jgi:hypothetical protein